LLAQLQNQIQKRRPEASGTNGNSEKNDVAQEPSIGDRGVALRWHGFFGSQGKQDCLCY
jgi:hypothetical protein